MDCTQLAGIIGKRSLFVDVESASWAPAQFAGVAQFARSHGINTLLVKVADGADVWYRGIAGYRAIRDTIKGYGIGVVPYTYGYGNKFGALSQEIAILAQLLQEDGVVCMDAEVEWNNQVTWATQLFGALRGVPGTFLVTTWANPIQQGWSDIVKALNPRVAAWLPQQYTNYLASQWEQFSDLEAKCLVPVVDLTNDFGSNDPVTIAQAAYGQGHVAIALWYSAAAMNNPGLTDQVLAAFPNTQENDMPIDITNSFAAAHFIEVPGSNPLRWHCTDKNHDFDVIGGILAYWRAAQGAFRLPVSDEIYNALPGGASFQLFEGGVLVWDPAGTVDNPGQGPCYAMHIDADTPGLRQLIARAGIQLGQDGLTDASINSARSALAAIVVAAQSAEQDLEPATVSVIA